MVDTPGHEGRVIRVSTTIKSTHSLIKVTQLRIVDLLNFRPKYRVHRLWIWPSDTHLGATACVRDCLLADFLSLEPGLFQSQFYEVTMACACTRTIAM